MKPVWKRLFSMVMVLCLLLSMLPINAFANEAADDTLLVQTGEGSTPANPQNVEEQNVETPNAEDPNALEPVNPAADAEESDAEEPSKMNTPDAEESKKVEPASETPDAKEPEVGIPAEESPDEEKSEEETPVEETPDEEKSEEETPAEETPDEEKSEEETPVEETPDEEKSGEETPAEVTPDEEKSEEETPVDETPSEENPAKENAATPKVVEETPSEEASDTQIKKEPTDLEKIQSYKAEAEALDPYAENYISECARIYNAVMEIYAANGSPTASENEEMYNAVGAVMGLVVSENGFNPYAQEVTADVKIAQGEAANYNARVERNTQFTIQPETDDITVNRNNSNFVRITVGQNCDPGTYTISYWRYGSYSFTVEVVESGAGSDSETNEKVKVYVYVATKIPGTNDSWADNPEFCNVIGLYKADSNKYFPAGEIELDPSYLTGKNYQTYNSPLINTPEDWEKLLAALSEIDTSTLIGEYAVNNSNSVNAYLSQASRDLNQSFGSQRSTLARWNNSQSYGFADQSVRYHLDLLFDAKKITFVTGNNGITDGNAKDGTVVDSRVYITRSVIQNSEATIDVPAGWRLVGFFSDPAMTNVWDGAEDSEEGVGERITKDSVVYIKIVPMDNVLLQYKVASGQGTVSLRDEALNPVTGVAMGSTAEPAVNWNFDGWYADEACTQKIGNSENFVPTKPEGGWVDTTYYAKFVPATADLIISKDYAGLPEGSEPAVSISVMVSDGSVVNTVTLTATAPSATVSGLTIGKTYTVEEVASSAAVENYILNTTYSPADGQVTITGGTNEVTVINTYTPDFTSVTATKVWNDDNDHDGFRPDSIKISLLANGVQVREATLTGEGNTWTHNFSDLPKFADGREITYTARETEVPEGYEMAMSEDRLTITNTHVPAKTTVTVTKVWNDADDQDGIRPESVTIELLVNGAR